MSALTMVDAAVEREVHAFLLHEAELIDDGEYRRWLELVTEDIRYVVPLRVSRERSAGNGVVTGMNHMDEDWDSLEMRTLRIETEHCWAEDPPSRVRHFVTNIRVRPAENEDELHVRSNVLLYRTRGDAPKYDLLCGERRDVLRWVGGELRLARREVLLDQSTVLTHNLAVIL